MKKLILLVSFIMMGSNLFGIDEKVEKKNIEQINKTNIFAFYVSWDSNSKTSLKKNIEKMDVVIPDWFRFNKDMTVRCVKQSEIDDILKKNNVKNMPLISNYINGKWDRKFVHKLISTPQKRSKHIDDLLSVVKSGGYYGVNIDYEDIDPLDKDAFTSFIKELSEKFHSNGYYVSVDLNPAWNRTFNYKELSNYVDYIVLMFYDESYSTGRPGPVASQEWFENQLDRVGDIPREKLITGLGNYGYDWILNSNKPAKSVSFFEAINTAKHKNSIVKWDPEKLNPYYMYKDGSKEHVVWFLDAVTLYNQLKYSVSKEIFNIALWRLGSEDPGIWDYIDKEKIVNESYTFYPSQYKIIRYGKVDGKKVFLTLDDGPDSKYTSQILDILKEYNVKAAFFVVVEDAEMNPYIIKRMNNEGHEVINHTFLDSNIINISDAEIKKENIMLLHDSGEDRSNTVKVLPEIIEGLRSKGYEFVTVSSLIEKTRDE